MNTIPHLPTEEGMFFLKWSIFSLFVLEDPSIRSPINEIFSLNPLYNLLTTHTPKKEKKH